MQFLIKIMSTPLSQQQNKLMSLAFSAAIASDLSLLSQEFSGTEKISFFESFLLKFVISIEYNKNKIIRKVPW